ncbi:MAG: hypothetical protein A3F17_01005 [Gammaproteobacteria bacterium RIFCSPHIGHO2_12_FULL_41_15]|nr:MAG: hypothetical protein A3F17_01005 [Gammaproteobacteria bacterium RIFCSPHIGHO2_12_FULL_41_15]
MKKSAANKKPRLIPLSVAALGVVFGDIGTSPLYAVRESLRYVQPNQDNILGVLSLIFWALIVVISIKYLIFIFRADNEGEGGTIALISLLKSKELAFKKSFAIIFLISLFGTSLLFADGMITPAISVLSAVEGLSIIYAPFSSFTISIAFIILLLLFSLQAHGSEKVGHLFGPIMIVWFITIAILGILSIKAHPVILKAVNPWYAILLFKHYHYLTLLILTGVFLVVTGGEALYADISHFGKTPIRLLWFSFVLPALLLNYFGQGADLLFSPQDIKNPFYLLAPHWLLYPLLLLATLATIIASQAVLSAVFSLAKQALTIHILPRMNVIFSSRLIRGQVYVPFINFIMAIGTLSLLITFQTSSNLAAAYGLAVNLVMIIVTFLVAIISYKLWHWGKIAVTLFSVVFLSMDCLFLVANSLKIFQKGWFTIVFAIIGTLIMLCWRNGLMLLREASSKRKITVEEISRKIHSENIIRVPGVAIFIDEPYDESKSCVFRHLESTNTIHEVTLLIDVAIENKPVISIHNRIENIKQTVGVYHIRLHYGFMQAVDIPNTLRICNEMKILPYLSGKTKFTYYLEMVNVFYGSKINVNTPQWQKRIFTGLLNTLPQNINFYHLPHNQTIMIGTYYDI